VGKQKIVKIFQDILKNGIKIKMRTKVKVNTILILTLILISGCTTATPSVSTSKGIVELATSNTNTVTNLQKTDEIGQIKKTLNLQCRQQLDAIQSYNKYMYNQYLVEFIRIENQTDRLLKIQDIMNEDSMDVLTPNYAFHVRSLCFQINNSLTQLIINSINEPKRHTLANMDKQIPPKKAVITQQNYHNKICKACKK
jgi:hypothetical protein